MDLENMDYKSYELRLGYFMVLLANFGASDKISLYRGNKKILHWKDMGKII